MFTGIVEERGEVLACDPTPVGASLTIRGPSVTRDTRPGDSIAVNGCCLTVVDVDADQGEFTVDVIAETLRRTSLRQARPGSPVNLERSLRADGRFSGHVVQGHVDGTGIVQDVISGRPSSDSWDEEIRWIGVPPELARYVAPKGSIAVDGVSLTVVEVRDEPLPAFSVALIPTTLQLTTLGGLRSGDLVNLEVDVMAKYVERLLQAAGTKPLSAPAHLSGSST